MHFSCNNIDELAHAIGHRPIQKLAAVHLRVDHTILPMLGKEA
jgi:hypothetical protein